MQLTAVGIIGASIVAPFFKPSMYPNPTAVIAGAAMAAVIGLFATRMVSYIDPKGAGKEKADA